MKRICLLLFAVASFGTASSQCSANFDFGTALWGASPDASIGEQFDTAYVDVTYGDVFHLLVPIDASAIDPEFLLPLDSMVLINTTLIGDSGAGEILNLADVGLEFQCNNGGVSSNPCAFHGGAQYCARLVGTPTTAGVYAMSIELEAWITVFGIAVPQPYIVDGYVLTIVDTYSSIELGCTDPTACNYSAEAVEDDGSCAEYDNCGICGGDGAMCLGCSDENACNYSELATIDDGSCYYSPCGEITVQFRVDMSQQAAISPNGVHIAGDFQGWMPGDTEMMDEDGDLVYTYTTTVDTTGTGGVIAYKYINGNAWTDPQDYLVGAECADASGNRVLEITESTIVTGVADTGAPHCFGSCGSCVAPTMVTFRVDMSTQEVISENGVCVAGSFQGWTPGADMLSDDDGDLIYEATLPLTPGTYQYKFINGTDWGGGGAGDVDNELIIGDCAASGNDNREIIVGTEAVEVLYCYNSCSSDCLANPEPDSTQCTADFEFGNLLFGVSPDASLGEQFDTAHVDVPYSDVFHLLVPVFGAEIVPSFEVPLDSMILVNTTLRADSGAGATMSLSDVGLDIQCNNGGVSSDPCAFVGGGQYCANLVGTPTLGGIYTMTFEVQIWVTVFGVAFPQPYFFDGYVLTIVNTSAASQSGCTDPAACNYSAEAVEDDGSCAELDNCGICGGDGTVCVGCSDIIACNYSELATIDDGSCYYAPSGGPCDCGDGFTLSATLSGSDTMSTTMTGSGYISSLAVTLDFTYFSDDSYASEVILFIESPDGQCIEIGGYDNTFGCPDTYSWPGDWSVPIGGQYTASINFLEPIGGIGTWTLGIGNGWEWSVNAGYVLEVTPDVFCEFDPVEGCMDVSACNFDALASTEANELCTYPGCADSNAINYDSAAGCEGDCVYLTYDCASIGEGSWLSEAMGVFPNWQSAMYGVEWSGEWVFNVPASVVEPSSGVIYNVHHVGEVTVSGVPEWLTHEALTGSLSPSSQYCIPASGIPNSLGAHTLYLSCEVFISIFGQPFSIGVQEFSAVLEVAENPNPIQGCTYVTALNFSSIATMDDGGCQFAGCTNPVSLNFTPLANVDDGSCIEECNSGASSSCASDSNGDGVVTVSDLLILLGEFGADCL